MPRVKSTNTDPFAAIDRLMKQEAEPTGPEWFTAYDYMDRYKRSLSQSHQNLNQLVREGVLEKWKGFSHSTKRVTTKFRTK